MAGTGEPLEEAAACELGLELELELGVDLDSATDEARTGTSA
jgi:hypothetical protein